MFISALEFSVSANDGQIGEVKPGMVFVAVAHRNSISRSSVHFVGFASRMSVLSSLRLRVHE
jgi:hypothetical protein